jgi:signal transduction histidine kinase
MLALMFWGSARAEAVQIAPSISDIDLSQSLEVLEDPAGLLSFDQIQSSESERFMRFAGGTPAYGGNYSVRWARVDLENTSRETMIRMVALDQPYYRELTLFIVNPDGTTITRALVAGTDRRDVDSNWPDPVFRVSLMQGTTRLVLRIKHHQINFGIHVRTADAESQRQAALTAFYTSDLVGFMLIFITVLALIYSTGDRRFLPFAFFVASILLVNSCIWGTIRSVVGEAIGSYGYFLGPLEMSSFTLTWFMRVYLRLETQLPWGNRAAKIMQSAIFAQYLLLFIDPAANNLSGPVTLIPFLILSTTILVRMGRHSREAIIFALGFVPFMVTGSVLVFMFMGLLPHNLTTLLIAFVPQGVSIMIFTLGLGSQVGTEMVERQRRLQASEAALIAANELLEQKVAARTQHLVEAQAQLVQAEKMASLGTLVAGVAHEMNTPMGVALTTTSQIIRERDNLASQYKAKTMTREMLDGFLDQAAEGLSIVLANLTRAADLVRSFKQVAADQASEAPRTINLGDYIEDILRNVQPIIRKASITIELDLQADLDIEVQSGALAQVITNLVQNAALHAFQDIADPRIKISCAREGTRIVIRFIDNGQGMTDEVRNKAFDPFFTTKRGTGGTGLGLHIVHNLIIGPLQGELKLNTAPGKGTEFIITIPG